MNKVVQIAETVMTDLARNRRGPSFLGTDAGAEA